MTSVREAVFPRDGASVSALIGDYLRRTEAEKAEHGLVPVDAPLPEGYAREIADPAVALAGGRVLVASVDGRDCGVVVAVTTEGGTALSRLWTTPTARGRGVGAALLDAALEGARGRVRLSVWRWREPAMRLYLRRGFVVVPSWDDRPDLICLERAAGAAKSEEF